jgi:hypothetical protein
MLIYLNNKSHKEKKLTPNGCGIHLLDDEWIQTRLLGRRAWYFVYPNLNRFLYYFLNICTIQFFKTPLYKYSIVQRMQVCFTTKTEFF